jgi:replicative DNA helicase
MSKQKFALTRPYDVEIEQQLLGRVMMFNEAMENLSFLAPSHFADPLHQRIYEAIVDAVRAGQVASPFTLKNEFEDDQAMKSVGGTTYLAVMATMAHNCTDPLAWGRMVHNMAFRRNIVDAARTIQNDVAGAPLEFSAEKLAAHAENLMAEAAGNASAGATERFRPVGDIASEVVQSLLSPKGEPTVLFGLQRLDDITGGMRAKELIIIGARPGMGKTAVAAHLARMAAKQGHGVAFFSMEMSAPAITLRMITSEAFDNGEHIAYEAMRRGQVSVDNHQAIFKAEGDLRSLPLRVHEGRGLTPSGIALAARRLQNEFASTQTPLGLVIVDHIQKIKPDRDCRGNKVAEMTEISDALQKMAGTLNVPVVALSQLNRAVESRGQDKRPELSDLRESGSIEQDADLVLLLYREAYYLSKSEPHANAPDWAQWHIKWLASKNNLEIHVAKQRNGPEGRAHVYFDAPTSALKDK